jgi:hypothetical protein
MTRADCSCGCKRMRGFNHVAKSGAAKRPPAYADMCRLCSARLTVRDKRAGLHRCSRTGACLERAFKRYLPPIRLPEPEWIDAEYARAVGRPLEVAA